MDNSKNTQKTNSSSLDRKVINFLEELTWLLSANSSIDFKGLPKQLSRLMARAEGELGSHASENPNIHFLTGVLPRILTNENIFANNEDIADFSEVALGVAITRWSKLNKFEIIGHIVCRVQDLDDFQLKKLVKALNKVLSGDRKAQNLVARKGDKKRDWNLIIQELTKDV